MLEMGCRLTVARTDAPAVRFQIDITLTHGDHRLDGDAHACFQQYTIATLAIVGHLRVLVHLTANAVSCQFANHAVTGLFAMHLNSAADVTQMSASYGILYTLIERLLGDLEQLPNFFGDLTHAERVAGIAIEAIEQRAAVDGDDVAVLQHRVRTRHSMHHHVIHRRTDAGWERTPIRIGKTLERGDGMMVTNELIGYLVQFQGRHPRLDMSS